MKKIQASNTVKNNCRKELVKINLALTGTKNTYSYHMVADVCDLKRFYFYVIKGDWLKVEAIKMDMDTRVKDVIPKNIIKGVQAVTWKHCHLIYKD